MDLFAYLGAIKEANGAAMSIGRISTFLDIYIERDLKDGILDEARAQELWDQLVQKLRIVRFLRTPDYDALFGVDFTPTAFEPVTPIDPPTTTPAATTPAAITLPTTEASQ